MFVQPLLLSLLTAATSAAQPLDDWHEDVVYQIFPRTFADGDGDGIGDLQGILGKVDYLHALGVNVIWLNPIYKSTHYDSNYDVTDYVGIDPQFGTLDDFIALRDALHARGMKLMLDVVLNHSSDEHPWFIQEKRLKTLQRTLTLLLQKASLQEGEQIINLLGDPASLISTTGTLFTQAHQAYDAFMAQDDTAAVNAGYMPKLDAVRLLARQLAPCVEHHESCPTLTLPFDDFYIWHDRPNNWTGIFSGSTWHKVEAAGGYYLALFSEHQVDLNWRNPRVRLAMENIVKIWEARGVDGLRLDSIGTLSKNPAFPNARPRFLGSTGRGIENYTHLPPVHAYMKELASAYEDHFRTIGEVAFTHEHPHAPMDYAGDGRGEMNEVFVFEHMGIDCNKNKWRSKPFVAADFKAVIDHQQAMMHNQMWLGNYVENHDQLRIVSRYGNDQQLRSESAKVFAALLMTLEGTPYIYQGQELAMTNLPPGTIAKVSDIEDIEARNYFQAQVQAGEMPAKVFHEVATRCRDHVRSAMQWNNASNAGFSTGTTTVRVNPNFQSINAEAELANPTSVLNFYRQLIALRHAHPSWVHGAFTDLLPKHPSVFAYTRDASREKTWVLLNFSDTSSSITLHELDLPAASDTVRLGNYPTPTPLATQMTLRPWEAVIVVAPLPPPTAAVDIQSQHKP